MSKQTLCNFCSLRQIKARAKKKDHRVIVRPDRGGTGVLVHPKHVSAKDARAKQGKYFVQWMRELTDSCRC